MFWDFTSCFGRVADPYKGWMWKGTRNCYFYALSCQRKTLWHFYENMDGPRQLMSSEAQVSVTTKFSGNKLWESCWPDIALPIWGAGSQAAAPSEGICDTNREVGFWEPPEGCEPCWDAQLPACAAWQDPLRPHPFVILSLLIWHQSWAGKYSFSAILRDFDTCCYFAHCSGGQLQPLPWTRPDPVKIEGNFHECQWGCTLIKQELVLTLILSWGNCWW